MSPALRGGVWSVATGRPPPYTGWALAAEHSCRNVPEQRVVADWVVICSVVEFIISATSGQERCAAAEKSTACTSAMAAKMGCSGVTRPSSGQSSAVENRLCCWRLLSGRWWQSAQGVSHHVLLAWCVSDVRCKLGNEGQLSLLAGRPGCRGAEQGCDQWLVVSDFDFESNTWRPTGSTSSPWADRKSNPSMGL